MARQIHESLRARFVAGEYLPGVRLYEEKLAKEFDVSLTPVREAVKLLESDGLVVRKAHRALFARQFTLKEAQEVYDVRQILEPHAASLVAQQLDPQWLDSMKLLLQEQKQALNAEEFGKVQTLTATFHIRIAQKSDNHLLASMIERIWLMVPLLRALAWYESHYMRPVHVVDEHRAMLDGMLLGPEQAAQLALNHVRTSWEGVKGALERALGASESGRDSV
nr:GntR family transcriptional regulator [Sulfobacillus harzensis]